MSDLLWAFQMANQVQEIVQTCKSIYWDRWETVKAEYKAKLEAHHQEHKTKNLLASAIKMSEWQDARLVLVLIGSSV